jgi:hypothetical protein
VEKGRRRPTKIYSTEPDQTMNLVESKVVEGRKFERGGQGEKNDLICRSDHRRLGETIGIFRRSDYIF